MDNTDPKNNPGHGGETHQQATGNTSTMTTQQGGPIADDQNSLKAGARGPTLMEDHILREKLFHFDHERIPERVVHARGFGAHGYFETTDTLEDITCADIFQRKGKEPRRLFDSPPLRAAKVQPIWPEMFAALP